MGIDSYSCAIYGLESQGRSLCSHNGGDEVVRFYAGTLSPKAEGLIHQIDFDEETNHITRKIYKSKVGEIWQVQCSPTNSQQMALTYNEIKEGSAHLRAGVFEVPDATGVEHNQDLKEVCAFKHVEAVESQECRCVDWNPARPGKISVVYDSGFVIWDLNNGSPETQASFTLSQLNLEEEAQNVYIGKWNPHLDGNQFSLAAGQSVCGIDVRSMKRAWNFTLAHKFQVRDVDFNPNKQYCFATCGDDCTSRFWDIRKPNECLKEIDEHTHWVWRIRYNSFHDQLVITSGSDSRVILHAVPSVSSEPEGHMVYDDADVGAIEENQTSPHKGERLQDGVLAKYEEHEDAVYVTEWSAYDPWIFASLSYDGRLVINRVPQSQKYKILL